MVVNGTNLAPGLRALGLKPAFIQPPPNRIMNNIHVNWESFIILVAIGSVVGYCIYWLFSHPSIVTSFVAAGILFLIGLACYWLIETVEIKLTYKRSVPWQEKPRQTRM